jgi:hypothetical protein
MSLERELVMLLATAMVLLVLWFLALGLFHVNGNFIHILVLVAMGFAAWHLMRTRRKFG